MKNLILIAAIILLTSCASTSIKYVSKKEFQAIAKSINMPSIAITYKLIGITKHRIYIERHDSILNKTNVYWTEKHIDFNPLIGTYFSRAKQNNYIGIWQNSNLFIIIEKNGVIKNWNATWDITKNNGIIIMFKNDSGVDVIKAKLNNINELMLYSDKQIYVRKHLSELKSSELPPDIRKILFPEKQQ